MKPVVQSFFRYPLDRIFENPAHVRVLRALTRHGGLMTTKMVMDQTNLTRMTVLAAIDRLAEMGLAGIAGSQRQRLNRFNDTTPLAAAIKGMFLQEAARYDTMIKVVREKSGRLGAEAVWIYGSVARGQDRPGSDIDIAVVCPNGKSTQIADALRGQLQRLGPGEPSVVVFDANEVQRLEHEQDPWWLAVKRDASVVLGAAPEAYLIKVGKRKTKNRDSKRKRKESRA
jgi:predicted nucleotidyltransferase